MNDTSPGRTALNRAVRRLEQYETWRRAVFTRDRFTCQCCSARNGRKRVIEADHIISLSQLLSQHQIVTIDDAVQCAALWDVSNGRTLCQSCHQLTASYPQQFIKKKRRSTMGSKLSTEQFIAKATLKHQGLYDYSKVIYTLAHAPVEIICRKHGSFSQKPGLHLFGHGCPKCAGTHRHTKESFIEKAKSIHGNRYDYSKAVYVNNRTKVEIGCPVHSSFWIKPNSHLSGHNCPKCTGNRPVEEIYKDFLEKSRQRHGDRYDYSQVELKKADEKVTIICREHGPFRQRIYKHMQGHGCPQCSSNKPLNTETFIRAAKRVHADRYNYGNTVYLRSSAKVEIQCQEHGPFQVTPNHHLRGVGCAKCDQLNPQRRSQFIELCGKHGRVASLYFIEIGLPDESFYKIGITSRSVKERLRPERLPHTLLHLFESTDSGLVWDLEKQLFRELKAFQYPPLLQFGGYTECFKFTNPTAIKRKIDQLSYQLTLDQLVSGHLNDH